MGLRDDFPECAAIEAHIRRARAERIAYVSYAIVEVVTGIWTALRHAFARGADAPASRHAAHRRYFNRLSPHR